MQSGTFFKCSSMRVTFSCLSWRSICASRGFSSKQDFNFSELSSSCLISFRRASLMATVVIDLSTSRARQRNPSISSILNLNALNICMLLFSSCFLQLYDSFSSSSTRISMFCSNLSTNDSAVPFLLPRAVRPTRCMQDFVLDGKSKFITLSTFRKSMPRDMLYSLSLRLRSELTSLFYVFLNQSYIF